MGPGVIRRSRATGMVTDAQRPKNTLCFVFFCNPGYHKSDSAHSAVQSQHFLPPADDRRKQRCVVGSAKCHLLTAPTGISDGMRKMGLKGSVGSAAKEETPIRSQAFMRRCPATGHSRPESVQKRRTHLRCLEKRCGSDFCWIQRGVSPPVSLRVRECDFGSRLVTVTTLV